MATNKAEESAQRPQFARTEETCRRYKIAPATLWRWIKTRNDFPRPLKAGPRVTLHNLDAIDAFIAAKARQ